MAKYLSIAMASLVVNAGCASAPVPPSGSNSATSTSAVAASTSKLRFEVPIAAGDAKALVETTYAGEELVRVAPAPAPPLPPGLPPATTTDDRPKEPHELESWRYPALGVWFFFDESERVTTIRLDPPFAGAVGGVRLGQTAAELTEARGAAQRTWTFGENTAVSYDAGTPNWVRYDVDPSGVIVAIFR